MLFLEKINRSNTNDKEKRISISLNMEKFEKIDRIATQLGLKPSGLIKAILNKYLMQVKF